MIVLDTNVLSELAKEQPHPAVRAWANAQSTPTLCATTISEAEILYGLAVMPAGRRQRALARAMKAVFTVLLEGRVLPFDRAAAAAYADIRTARKRRGHPVPLEDLQIAAIARSGRATAVATRNVGHFHGFGVPTIDPWAHS